MRERRVENSFQTDKLKLLPYASVGEPASVAFSYVALGIIVVETIFSRKAVAVCDENWINA